MDVAVAGVEDVADAQPVPRGDGADARAGSRAASCAARRRPACSSSAPAGRRRRRRACGSSTARRARPRRAPRAPRGRRCARQTSTHAARPARRARPPAPSSSTSSTAPASVGKPTWKAASTAPTISWSIISSAAGTMPAAMMPDTVAVGVVDRSSNTASSVVAPPPAAGTRRSVALRDDAERSLGTDDKPRRSYPGTSSTAPPSSHHLAVGQHQLDAEHVIGRDAVLERVRPAGVLGDVAADGAGRLAGGIGRVEEPVRPPRRASPTGSRRPPRRRRGGWRGRWRRCGSCGWCRPSPARRAAGSRHDSPVPAPRGTNATPRASAAGAPPPPPPPACAAARPARARPLERVAVALVDRERRGLVTIPSAPTIAASPGQRAPATRSTTQMRRYHNKLGRARRWRRAHAPRI